MYTLQDDTARTEGKGFWRESLAPGEITSTKAWFYFTQKAIYNANVHVVDGRPESRPRATAIIFDLPVFPRYQAPPCWEPVSLEPSL